MELAEFMRRLAETGRYETPPNAPRSRADRVLGRFDWWYHLRNVLLFADAGRVARRGGYDSARFQADSFGMMRVAEDCGGRVCIAGFDRLLALQTPAVVVSNHMSLLETTMLPMLLLSRGSYVTVVKESLLRFPFMGAVLKSLDAIAVARKNPREDLRTVLEKGRRALENGKSVLLFPQARRSRVFDAAHFNSLGAKLARRGGVKLMPVAVKTDFVGMGPGWLRDFGPLDRGKTIHVEFGPPARADENEREAHQLAVDFITERVRAWGGEVA